MRNVFWQTDIYLIKGKKALTDSEQILIKIFGRNNGNNRTSYLRKTAKTLILCEIRGYKNNMKAITLPKAPP